MTRVESVHEGDLSYRKSCKVKKKIQRTSLQQEKERVAEKTMMEVSERKKVEGLKWQARDTES